MEFVFEICLLALLWPRLRDQYSGPARYVIYQLNTASTIGELIAKGVRLASRNNPDPSLGSHDK